MCSSKTKWNRRRPTLSLSALLRVQKLKGCRYASARLTIFVSAARLGNLNELRVAERAVSSGFYFDDLSIDFRLSNPRFPALWTREVEANWKQAHPTQRPNQVPPSEVKYSI